MNALRVPDSCSVCGGEVLSLRVRQGAPVCKAHARTIDRVPQRDLRAVASGVCPDCAMARIALGRGLYDRYYRCRKHDHAPLSDCP